MSAMMEKVKLFKLEELPVLIGKEVEVNGESIAVFRLDSGDVYAIGSRCPHTNGPLAEGIVSGEFVYCPLKDWKVSLITGEVQPPDEGQVKTYQTEVMNREVFIHV
ncbi:nitrite reductase (NAD(P)H) small subunit [Texcoconibacillus texcoconensis]|uniref:Nitrite reductase (NADH) small subunit n=1 Tax=Texcoconibacillus texcoconensis TaxID=1095777 RepID=A0A840QRP5_9BACI|nr:nitrite reductase (NAD(P)H) small subunit [Texcoconibacillus texcoconensis]MBB5174034.1 nitrite reductase (NADH) small subunit [Texcoconibacillus texcoconensis]